MSQDLKGLQNFGKRCLPPLLMYGKDLYPKYLSAPVRVVADFLDGLIKSGDNIDPSNIPDHQRSFDDVKVFQVNSFSKLHYLNSISYEEFKRSLGASLALMDLEREDQVNYPGNQGFEVTEIVLGDIANELSLDINDLKKSYNPNLTKAYQQANKFLDRFKDGIMNGVPFFEMKNMFKGKSVLHIIKFLNEMSKPVIELNKAIDRMAKLFSKDIGSEVIDKFNSFFEEINDRYPKAPSKKDFLQMMTEINTNLNSFFQEII